MNGFVNVIKPKDMSSALAVMLIKKKIYKAFGKVSIGHMGTLDPMASGVLPMGINQANRMFDYLLDKQKTYIADFTFGKETDTLDTTGNVVSDGYIVPTLSEIESVLSNFIGMTTDSRSFLSFIRHDYFRRVLCDWLGEKWEKGEMLCDMQSLKNLAYQLCYGNAKQIV